MANIEIFLIEKQIIYDKLHSFMQTKYEDDRSDLSR